MELLQERLAEIERVSIASGSHGGDEGIEGGACVMELVSYVAGEPWSTSVRQVLVVTALKARWNRETSDAIGRAGSHGAWMRKQLPGDVLHDIEYQDGASPMAQIALRRPA